MEAEEARRLRSRWFGKPCCHPGLEPVVVQGSSTGGYVCQVCGSEFRKVALWENIHLFLCHSLGERATLPESREEGEQAHTGAGSAVLPSVEATYA
jgi:hypothetical protein